VTDHREHVTSRPELSVVVPFYNEEENVPEVHRRLKAVLATVVRSHELVFVNDGSRDATSRLLNELQQQDADVVVLHLSRNFGHQAAICAGIDHARGDALVVMDGDLQDAPEAIADFVAAWREGAEVVYAVRTKRKESAFKRAGYFVFYRLLHFVSDLDIPLDSGDFCLMTRKVSDALRSLPERNRFVRGLRTFVGFRQVGLPYERHERAAGRPKYTLAALVALAIDGLVSFSSHPLRLASYAGFGTAALAGALIAWAVFDFLVTRTAPAGWASTVIVLLVMSSVQLISLGIIGEYLRRVFIEAKERPPYIVDQVRATWEEARVPDTTAPANAGARVDP
jgi:polyisoprenyl-phosphate glycosyltransferase